MTPTSMHRAKDGMSGSRLTPTGCAWQNAPGSATQAMEQELLRNDNLFIAAGEDSTSCGASVRNLFWNGRPSPRVGFTRHLPRWSHR